MERIVMKKYTLWCHVEGIDFEHWIAKADGGKRELEELMAKLEGLPSRLFVRYNNLCVTEYGKRPK